MAKRRKKSEMPKVIYKGYEIHEVSEGKWQVSMGIKGYYPGSENSVTKAKERVDRIIESYKIKKQ